MGAPQLTPRAWGDRKAKQRLKLAKRKALERWVVSLRSQREVPRGK